jgi:tetratricopeptide (TPR) repeat protein
MLSLALRRAGAVERALAASDEALRAAGDEPPSLAAVLVQRTGIFLQLSRVEDAKAAAKRAVAAAPTLVDAHTAMSDVLVRENDWVGAEAAQAEAIRLGGPNGRAKLRSVHAGLLWQLDRLEECAAEADVAITRGERTPFSLAYASMSRSLRPAPTPDDLRIAQATADALRTSFPDSGWGWLARGAALRAAGRWTESIEALLQAYRGDDVPYGPVLALMLEPYARLGRTDDVASVTADLKASSGDPPVARPPLVERLVREAGKAGTAPGEK